MQAVQAKNNFVRQDFSMGIVNLRTGFDLPAAGYDLSLILITVCNLKNFSA
jgi:hypothetical protein